MFPGFLPLPAGIVLGPHRLASLHSYTNMDFCKSQELWRKWIWLTEHHMKLFSGFGGRWNFAFCFVFKQTQNLKSRHCWNYWVPPGSCEMHVIPRVLYGLGKSHKLNQNDLKGWTLVNFRTNFSWAASFCETWNQEDFAQLLLRLMNFDKTYSVARFYHFVIKLTLTGVFFKAFIHSTKWPCENLIFHVKESRSFQSLWLWWKAWTCAQVHQQFKTEGDCRDSIMHFIILNSVLGS